MRVLVTGAGGFVGTWLIKALRTRLGSTAQIFAAAPQSDPGVREGVTCVPMDVTKPEQVASAISAIVPSSVIHLAAISFVPEARRDPRHTWEVNFGGTMHLAHAILEHSPAARLIFAGSSEVYGGTFNAQGGVPLNETALLDPTNTYAASKAAADLLLGQMAHDGLRVVRFRPFNHTGPGQADRFAIPAFATQIARIERGLQPPTMRVGNLDARRDLIDVRDVVSAYVLATMAQDGPSCQSLFNLASGVPRRIGDVLEALLSRAQARINVESEPSLMRRNDTPLALGDATRAREVLGWYPRIPWDNTLDDVLDHCRAEVDRQMKYPL